MTAKKQTNNEALIGIVKRASIPRKSLGELLLVSQSAADKWFLKPETVSYRSVTDKTLNYLELIIFLKDNISLADIAINTNIDINSLKRSNLI